MIMAQGLHGHVIKKHTHIEMACYASVVPHSCHTSRGPALTAGIIEHPGTQASCWMLQQSRWSR